jgi:hypothetical protein
MPPCPARTTSPDVVALLCGHRSPLIRALQTDVATPSHTRCCPDWPSRPLTPQQSRDAAAWFIQQTDVVCGEAAFDAAA